MTHNIKLLCAFCGTSFFRSVSDAQRTTRGKPRNTFCSRRCHDLARTAQNTQTLTCEQCQTPFVKSNGQIRKTHHNFCSLSCAATWRNFHKTHGARRSKLEVWLEKRLRERYPDLEILFNAKEAINAELDIHFPSLNLAFELNGIYHYEPIHGSEKLASIQTNDHRKFAACAERGISLCVIDVSTMIHFKPAKGQRFLEIILNIVDGVSVVG